jgi:2-keto-4-pentenoate hydratase/2-oxohepta-3-ene-1,7-dioic acid hydratase in catechol pathway
MKIAQFEHDGNLCIGVALEKAWFNYTKAAAVYYLLVHDIHTEPAWTLADLIEHEEFDLEEMHSLANFVQKENLLRLFKIPTEAQLRAPIMRPGKIVALGLNYALHAKEGNLAVPKEPIIFAKAGSSVIGPGDPICLPQGVGRIDHEVELAVIIGKRCTGVTKESALEYVAGYTIINDVTARELQTSDLEVKHPWFRSKSFDTFTPMGPWMVTTDEIKIPGRLSIECRVNGKVRQRSNTSNLVFDVPAVISHISQLITLEPGDVISTGTPEGIGEIVSGDEVVCRIEKIGELANPVRER